MPKAPKDTRKSKRVCRALQNTPFREALGLSTSDADIDTFINMKKTLRTLVESHYDLSLSDSEQSVATRVAFAAEVARTMPQLYATETSRRHTDTYVARHFANISWQFRCRKSVSQATAGNINIEGATAQNRSENIQDHPNIAVPPVRGTPGSSQIADDQVMLEDDKNEDEVIAIHPTHRKRGRPRKNGIYAPDVIDESTSQEPAPIGEENLPTSSTPISSMTTISPTIDIPPPSYVNESEETVHQFLRSCKPNLEQLLPVFVRIGLENKTDFRGILDWPTHERVSWLMELSREDWGISRLHVKSLSLAFDVAQLYEARMVTMGTNPRRY